VGYGDPTDAMPRQTHTTSRAQREAGLGLPKMGVGPQGQVANPYDIVSKSTAANADLAQQTGGGKVGAGLEGVGEYMAGEGLLKGLTAGERLMEIAKATKLLEKYPAMAEAAQWAKELKPLLTAGKIARTAAVSAGQSALHAEPGQTAHAAEVGAGYGAAGGTVGEALGAGASYFAKRTPDALASGAAAAAKEDFESKAIKTIQEFLGTQNETQKSLTNVAQTAVDKVGNSLSPENRIVASAKGVRGLGTGTHTVAQGVDNFGDSAAALKSHAEKLFGNIDELSDNSYQPAKLAYDKAYKMAGRATSVDDLESAEGAKEAALVKINSALDKATQNSGGKITSDTLSDAKSLWKAQDTLQSLHDRIDMAFNRPAKSLALAGQDETNRFIDLKRFSTRLNGLITGLPEDKLKQVLSPEDIRSLYSVADQASNESLLRESLINMGIPPTAMSTSAETVQGLSQGLTAARENAAQEAATASLKAGKVARAGFTRTNLGSILGGEGGLGIGMMMALGHPAAIASGLGVAGLTHALVAYPEFGKAVFGLAAKSAPIASQAFKNYTHTYDPTNGLQAVSDQTQSTEPSAFSSDIPDTAASTKSAWSQFGGNMSRLADSIEQHEGGKPERNNPGNLKFAGQAGAVKDDKTDFAKFDTYEAGREALESQLMKYKQEHPSWTLADLVRTYSPDKQHGGDNENGTEASYVKALMASAVR